MRTDPSVALGLIIAGSVNSKPIVGLGDKIDAVAKPIAKAIDKVAKTKISGCMGCKQMRDRLNAGMSITEATEMRAIEFALRNLNKRRQSIFKRVDARLKSNDKPPPKEYGFSS